MELFSSLSRERIKAGCNKKLNRSGYIPFASSSLFFQYLAWWSGISRESTSETKNIKNKEISQDAFSFKKKNISFYFLFSSRALLFFFLGCYLFLYFLGWLKWSKKKRENWCPLGFRLFFWNFFVTFLVFFVSSSFQRTRVYFLRVIPTFFLVAHASVSSAHSRKKSVLQKSLFFPK